MSGEQTGAGLGQRLSLYMEASHGPGAGFLRDALVAAASWVPGLAGIALRSVWDGLWMGGGGFAMESGVRVLGSRYIRIGRGAYIDRGVYLHGRPGGLEIGEGTRVMSGAVLHVYNFRSLPGSGIRTGKNCVIGINSIITGQGGVELGDDVIVGPGVMILPVNHVFGDDGPIRDQGLEAKGIGIGAGAWIGAGAIVLDAVKVGENAVVGAGSVVTRDVEPGQVVAGNPARPMEGGDSK